MREVFRNRVGARNVFWLYAGRGLRSFATAFLTVAFPLYLTQSGYGSGRIGLVVTLSTLVTAALVAVVGIVSDRVGRKLVLMVLGVLAVFGSIGIAISTATLWIAFVSGISGIGRGGGAGSGGSWGPVFPAEQPLLASAVPAEQRNTVFSRIAFVGVLAGAGGSLVAALPRLLHSDGLSWIAAYRWLFYLSAALAVLMVAVTIPLREERIPASSAMPPTAAEPSLRAGGFLGRLSLTNALNGLGFGFLGPLLTYWFHARFGVGPAALGTLYAITNLVAALPYLGAARLAQRFGSVWSTTITRAVSVVMLLAMAVAPTYALAGLAYVLRMAFNSVSIPLRQSFVMGVSRADQRGRMAAFSMLPSQLTSTISPVLGGELMQSFLDTPLVGAAVFMTANFILYYLFFRDLHPPEETERAAPRSA